VLLRAGLAWWSIKERLLGRTWNVGSVWSFTRFDERASERRAGRAAIDRHQPLRRPAATVHGHSHSQSRTVCLLARASATAWPKNAGARQRRRPHSQVAIVKFYDCNLRHCWRALRLDDPTMNKAYFDEIYNCRMSMWRDSVLLRNFALAARQTAWRNASNKP